MTSGATKMTQSSNMHMDTRVVKVAEFKLEVIFDLRGQ